MKQILVKAYLANNLGDDLFLKVLFDRYPNIRWIIEDIPGKNMTCYHRTRMFLL